MAALSLNNFNLIMETENPDNKLTFQWSIRNINKLPAPIRSSRFSMAYGQPRDWDVGIWHEKDDMLHVSLAYNAPKDAVPIHVQSVSRILEKEGSMRGPDDERTTVFYGGNEHPLFFRLGELISGDDILYFQCSLTVHGYGVVCNRNLYSDDGSRDVEELRNDYLRMLESKEFADVKIIVGDRCLAAHRCVLKHLFPNFFDEHKTEIMDGEVNILLMFPTEFDAVLQSIYQGKVNQSAIDRHLVQLHKLAVRYEVRYMIKACTKEIIYKMKPETVCNFYVMAIVNKADNLVKYCEAFIIDNLRYLESNVQYKLLMDSYPHLPRTTNS